MINTIPMLELEDELTEAGVTSTERQMLGAVVGAFAEKAGLDLTIRVLSAAAKSFRSLTPEDIDRISEAMDAALFPKESRS